MEDGFAWCEYIDAKTVFFDPIALAIKELQPATIPIPADTIKKYSGNALAKAAKASDEIFPA